MNQINIITPYEKRVDANYPGMNYPVESKEGNELQDLFDELNRIPNDVLSPEQVTQRDSLLTKIVAEKIRGFI